MKKLAVLIGLFVLWGAGTAEAVPQTISFTGRLTTSSGPVTGSVNLTFKLFDDPTGGTALWTEVRNGVGANSTGLVFVDLGQVTTLDSTLFTGSTMYLEITVGSETLSPRLAINSVPYAMHTADSDTLGGTIGAADVITSAAGSGGITATKTGNALAVSLTTTGCSNGQVYKYNGTTFACANDADTVPAAGAGIAVSGSTVSLSTMGCSAGYVWKYTGSAWSCQADANTTYTAGPGIAISGTTVGLSTTGCAAGDVWKYDGTAWACVPDAGLTAEGDGVIGNEVFGATDASLTRSGSGTGASPYTLALNTAHANTWSALQTFDDVKVAGTALLGLQRVIGTTVNLLSAQSNCQNYDGLATCYYGIATMTCPSGTRLLGGGCFVDGGYILGNLHRSYPSSDTTWTCIATSTTNATKLTAYGFCARVGL